MMGDFSGDAYSKVLTTIYGSFLKVKLKVEGRPDSDVRSPHVIKKLARELGILPDAEKTVRITGSKGKGTTTRLIASLASALAPGKRVGCFVSPEEFEHTDRIRIDGDPIPVMDFIRIYEGLLESIKRAETQLRGYQYMSPFGQFLLIALAWFKENNVDVFVLETGRGARFDEVGQIESRVSVITSIFEEHPASLGPSIRDIAWNKAGVFDNSEAVLVSEQANSTLRLSGLEHGVVVHGLDPRETSQLPKWVALDYTLARAAIGRLLGVSESVLRATDVPVWSASFGSLALRGKLFVYDATINSASLDPAYMSYLRESYGRTRALVSLPDDKDRGELISALRNWAAHFQEIVLSGTRGYLHYEQALTAGQYKTFQASDVTGLADFLRDLVDDEPEVVYLVGTQSYIRLVKLALARLAARTGSAAPTTCCGASATGR